MQSREPWAGKDSNLRLTDYGTTPPPDVTVTSQAGGSTTVPVVITGDAMAAIQVQAFAGVTQTVQQGQSVTLDGSGSTGPVKSYSWEQLTGPTVTLNGTDKAKATFTAPSAATDLTFRLTVTGPGGPSTSEATVHVAAVQTPVANAGPDRTVAQSTLVQLDGTASTNATGYQWDAPTGATLTGANTATPSFTFPKQTTPLTFTLRVTGPGGTSAPDTVTISPALDTLATSKVRFIASKNQWEVVGTATSTLNNTITIHQGSTLSGAVIGKATVDALGAWTFKGPGTTATTISIESARGGQRLPSRSTFASTPDTVTRGCQFPSARSTPQDPRGPAHVPGPSAVCGTGGQPRAVPVRDRLERASRVHREVGLRRAPRMTSVRVTQRS